MLNERMLLCDGDEPLWIGDEAGGFSSERGLEIYTEGDCWALAWHVARELHARVPRARIVTLGRWPNWDHVCVQIERDVYLDARGMHSRRELRDAWFGNPVQALAAEHQTSLEAYVASLDAEFCYPLGHDTAAAFARRLIAAHMVRVHDAHLNGSLIPA